MEKKSKVNYFKEKLKLTAYLASLTVSVCCGIVVCISAKALTDEPSSAWLFATALQTPLIKNLGIAVGIWLISVRTCSYFYEIKKKK
jgi:hypothetical protein